MPDAPPSATPVASASLHASCLPAQALLDAIADAVVATDCAGLVIYWGPGAAALYGCGAAEALGRPLSDLCRTRWYDPDDEERARQALEREGRWRGTSIHLLRSGDARHVESTVSVLRDAAGIPLGFLAVTRERTDGAEEERAAPEVSRRSAEERPAGFAGASIGFALTDGRRAAELETVLDTVPAAVWIARDPRGDRIDANRFGAELLRRRRGQNVSITSPGDDRPRHFSVHRDGRPVEEDELPIQQAARQGREIRGAEIDVVFDDGEVRHLLGNAAPIPDGEGGVKGSVGAFIDITERKHAEQALREAHEKLREADRRKSRFIAVLSHELRNPLASIRNALVLAERVAPESEPGRRARAVLHRQTEHLARLVDDLLDIARISGGRIELRRGRIDAREVARRACEDHLAAYEQRGVGLLKLAPEPVWVEADAARLAQMIGNLLNNALKFTAPGGRVQLAVQARDGACRIAVRDSGIGIAPDDLPRLFEPFAQAERTRGHSVSGLGIGLSLVRELAALHGGSVRASSEGVDRGAEFVLELPLASPPGADAPAPRPAGPTGSLSVLLVEDNEDAGATLAEVLALAGHRVSVVSTGAAAVAALAAAPPDVLLCDIGLPDMPGHEVVRALRARREEIRTFAIALTGYAQRDDRERALAAGFDAHLAKPPSLELLHALLAEAAGLRATRALRPS